MKIENFNHFLIGVFSDFAALTYQTGHVWSDNIYRFYFK